MLGDLSGVRNFYIVTGYTDMRKSIDGLMAVIEGTYSIEPDCSNAFLFCGRNCDRIKVIHIEKDGICLMYKRLHRGRYKWPRSSEEARLIDRRQLRWLLEGLSIDQKTAIPVA